MMKANKKVMAALLAAMMTVSAGAAVVNAAEIVAGPGSTTVTTTTGKWYREPVKVGNNWVYRYSYQNSDGTFAKAQWKLLDGKWYFFDDQGYALSEEYNTNNGLVDGTRLGYDAKYGYTFRFDKNCAMVTGWYQRTDSASDPTATVSNGWEFYDYNTGTRKTGWIKDGANWFFITDGRNVFDDDKVQVKGTGELLMNGTYMIDGVWYTFAANGVMQNQGQGWVKDGDNWYWVQEDGSRFHGITTVKDGTGYIYDSNSWKLINGKYYLFNDKNLGGEMLTGWQRAFTDANKTDNKWYYMTANGDCVLNSWIKIGNDWYLTNASGEMVTGWAVRGGKTYYLNETADANGNLGVMMTGTVKIGANNYTFDASGALVSINGQKVDSGVIPQ
ncbi:MAG: hypothetical protein ACOX60_04730 [Massiliimalia sp.]|jgi:glucan-binding YG repeat protein